MRVIEIDGCLIAIKKIVRIYPSDDQVLVYFKGGDFLRIVGPKALADYERIKKEVKARGGVLL